MALSKVLSAAQIPDKYEFTEFNTIARVCCVFPYSLTVIHMSVCSQTGLHRTASTPSFARKSAGMNANEQRRAASRQSTGESRLRSPLLIVHPREFTSKIEYLHSSFT